MTTMTDSRAVEVLDRLRARASEWGDDTANVAALDHAIARLCEPAEAQAQGGGESEHDKVMRDAYLYGTGYMLVGKRINPHDVQVVAAPPSAPVGVIGDAIRHLSKWLDLNDCECDSGHQCGRIEVERTRDQLRTLAQQPAPVAPVGVEALVERWRTKKRDLSALGCANELERALAQQPASDGGFTAGDMMDARQEGRKEAQQPADDDVDAEQFRKGWQAGFAEGRRDQQPAPSAPVGVPADILRIVDTAIDVCNDRDRPAMSEDLEAVRLYVEQTSAALAQQPAAVDGSYPTPRNRAEAAALARLALAHLGVIDAHIDAAIARCETNSAAQPGGSDNDR